MPNEQFVWNPQGGRKQRPCGQGQQQQQQQMVLHQIIPATGQRVPYDWFLLPDTFFDVPTNTTEPNGREILEMKSQLAQIGMRNPKGVMICENWHEGAEFLIIQAEDTFFLWGRYLKEMYVIAWPECLFDIVESLYKKPYTDAFKTVPIEDYAEIIAARDRAQMSLWDMGKSSGRPPKDR